jgi:hypothetical protein
MSVDLAFILVKKAVYPDPRKLIASAAKLGIELTMSDATEPMAYSIGGGGTFIVMLMQAPHPDVPTMNVGPMSPTTEEAAAAPAHFVATAMGLEGSARSRDTKMALLASAIITNTEAIGVMLGHGVVFHKAGLFAEMAALSVEEGVLPAEIAVDVTAAREPNNRMSFLTHGMQRYGREELYMTAPVDGQGALGFLYQLVRWMLTDLDKQFATGETLGRTAQERIEIQRVPSPTGEGPPVMKLDLPK